MTRLHAVWAFTGSRTSCTCAAGSTVTACGQTPVAERFGEPLAVYIPGVYTEHMNQTTTNTCGAYKCSHEIKPEVSLWCDAHRPDWAVVATTDPTPWRYWPQYGQNEVREVRFATQRDAFAYGASNAVYAPRADGFELAEGVR